jgi:peptide/nickel transport system permease protein
LGRYILRRLLQVPLTLVLVSIIVFSIVHLTPGDPARLILGDFATDEDVDAFRARHGMDRPFYVQYLSWMSGVVRGDLGTSINTGESVASLIITRAPYTISLAVSATIVATLIAIVLGILAAKFHNRPIDQIIMVFAMLGMAMPSFVVAILLILVFAVALGIFPIAGPGDPVGDPIGSIRYYVLPVTSLALLRVAQFTRIVRSSMLDVLNRDYIRSARAKGLSERVVVVRHALKNALIPVITIVTLSFAETLAGTVVTEAIFSIPGLGSLMLNAIVWRDFLLVQGITLVVALIFIFTNLVADLLYGIVDPRIRYE